MKLKEHEVLVLRRNLEGNISYGGFEYPEKGIVEAKDWEDSKECGNGLHGWTLGFEDYYNYDLKGNFVVILVNKKDGYVELDGKVKFKKGKVILNTHDVNRAHELMLSVYPTMMLHLVTQTAGHRSTQTAGIFSAQTAGHRSTQTAGHSSTQTAGIFSAQTAGNRSTQTAGHSSTQTAGIFSAQTAGHRSTQTAGSYSTQTAGHGSIQTAGSCSTQTAGHGSIQTAGHGSIQRAGDESTFIQKSVSGTYSMIKFAKNSVAILYEDDGTPNVHREYENETVCFFSGKEVKRYKTTPVIEKLEKHEIFVFGSNLKGNHAGGAAKLAKEKFGAEEGVGEGLTGQCYAFPTLDENMKKVSIESMKKSVDKLIECAQNNTTKIFLVTKVGCGIAGFEEDEVRELFGRYDIPGNIVLPWEYLFKK